MLPPIPAPRFVRLGQLPANAPSQATIDLQAQVQSSYQSVSADARAKIDAQTGSAQNTQRLADGATAAASLATNGFDPNSKEDEGKVIAAISGGLVALGPATAGVSIIIAGALEALWQVGNAIACPVVNAFASLGIGSSPPDCGGARCSTSGNWTAGGILQSHVPAMPSGSFAAFVVPLLAVYKAKQGNCLASFPPDVVVDAATAIWNQTHAGPAADYYIPPIETGPGGIIYAPGTVQGCDELGQSCNVDMNITYGFGPNAATPWGHGLIGFPTTPGNSYLLTTPLATAPRTVSVNTGALIQKTSTATSVVKHVGVAGVGALAGGLAYAWVTGKAIDHVFEGLWGQTKTLFDTLARKAF